MSGPASPARLGATLGRSVRLFTAFRSEQSDPDRFYTALAADSVRQLRAFAALDEQLVLDVGGGPGYFAAAFADVGARYLALDTDAGELSAADRTGVNAVVASGMDLPVRSGSIDVCYSSNVLEHVSDPWRMAGEMVRVTRSGGLVFLSFTVWWGPWGGHETAPWHYLGGRYAATRYTKRVGHPPKNVFGESLFAVTVAQAQKWAGTQRGAQVIAVFPRYLPGWAHPVVHVPGLREVVVWNLVLVLRPW